MGPSHIKPPKMNRNQQCLHTLNISYGQIGLNIDDGLTFATCEQVVTDGCFEITNGFDMIGQDSLNTLQLAQDSTDLHCYRPQTKFTRVCLSTRGWHGRGGVCGRGHAWQGGVRGGGHAWQGVCMVGGACLAGGMHGRGCMAGGGPCVVVWVHKLTDIVTNLCSNLYMESCFGFKEIKCC